MLVAIGTQSLQPLKYIASHCGEILSGTCAQCEFHDWAFGGTCTISVPEFDIAALDEMMSWEEGLMCRTVPEEFCSTFEDVL